jgi:hypothetical protein
LQAHTFSPRGHLEQCSLTRWPSARLRPAATAERTSRHSHANAQRAPAPQGITQQHLDEQLSQLTADARTAALNQLLKSHLLSVNRQPGDPALVFRAVAAEEAAK